MHHSWPRESGRSPSALLPREKKKSPAAAPQEEAELADGIYTLVKSLLKEIRRRRMGNYAGEKKKRERERRLIGPSRQNKKRRRRRKTYSKNVKERIDRRRRSAVVHPVVVLLLPGFIYIAFAHTAQPFSSLISILNFSSSSYIGYIVAYKYISSSSLSPSLISTPPCLDCGVVPRLYISFFDPLVFPRLAFATQSYNCRHFPRHANLLYTDTYVYTATIL
jgi:hypothetical protein